MIFWFKAVGLLRLRFETHTAFSLPIKATSFLILKVSNGFNIFSIIVENISIYLL